MTANRPCRQPKRARNDNRQGEPMTVRRTAAYLAASFAVGVFSAFNNFTMSLWLSQFALSYVLISLFGNSRSLEGAVVGPIAGAWSDRTYLGWLGRRRPFVLVGGL